MAVSVMLEAAAATPALPCIPAWNGFHGSDDLSSTILSATRGPDGFIYLGGRDALYRLEGGSIQSWLPDFADEQALPAGRIQALLRTDNALWVGTEAGLVRYHPDTDQFTRISLGSSGIKASGISSLAIQDQWIWVGTSDGMARISLAEAEREGFTRAEFLPGSPNEATGLAEIGGTVVIGAEGGLYTYDPGVGFRPLARDVVEQQVTSLTLGPQQRLWISTETMILRSDDETFEGWTIYDHETFPGLPNQEFTGVMFDQWDRLWVASRSGLARWDFDEPEPVPCRSTTTGSDRDQGNSVAFLSNDLGPYMFMGTKGRGAAFAPMTEDISLIIPGTEYNNGLPDTVIWSTAIAPDGRLHTGTTSGLFAEREAGRGAFKAIDPDMLGDLRVYDVFAETSDVIWAGTNRGLFRVEGGEASWVPLVRQADGTAVKPSVYDIRMYSDHLVAGTDSGLFALSRSNASSVFFRTKPDHIAIPPNTTTTDIEGGRIWSSDVLDHRLFVAGNDIAFEADLASGQVVASTNEAVNAGELIVGRIFTITAIDSDRVYLGTEAGLIEASSDFSSFESVNRINSLRLESVMSSGRASDGALWIGVAGHGVFRSDPDTGIWNHITQSDGLITNGASQLGLAFGPQGEVVVSNGTGASVIRRVPHSSNEDIALALHAEDSLRGRSIETQSRLMIGPDDRDLRVHFKIPELLESRMYDISYTFSLHGKADAPQTVKLGEDLMFRSLAPGIYDFVGEVRSTSGYISDPLSFSVQVTPFWWERTFVHVAAGAGGILAVFGLFMLRANAIEHRYKLVADERKRIAQDLHDTFLQDIFGARMIGRSLVDNQSSDDSRSKVEKMMGLLETATGSVRTSVQTLSQLTDVPALSEAIRRCEVPERYGCELDLDVSETGHSWHIGAQRRFFLARIVQEAINNSCKHAHAQHITVRMAWTWKGLDLTVSDDGQGFDVQSEQAKSGFGIGAMKRMAEAARTHFSVSSSTGSGANVHLRVPRFAF
ncbi:MAG: ATP-binding protein [Pseudomonadota bacterium]